MLTVVAAATSAATAMNSTAGVGRNPSATAARPAAYACPVAGSMVPSHGTAPISATMTPTVSTVTIPIPTARTRGMFRTGSSSSSPISIIIPNPWNGMYNRTTARKNGPNPASNSVSGNSGVKFPGSNESSPPTMKVSIPSISTPTAASCTFVTILMPK